MGGQVNPVHRELEIVLRDLKISTMSNITVISRSEKTDVTGKLVIENVLSELKEAKAGSFFTSDVFHAEDFAFQLVIYLKSAREKYEHSISTFIYNRTGEPVLLTNVCFELKAIPPNSTETVTLARNKCNEVKIPPNLGRGNGQMITHNGLKEACEEGDDLLLLVKAQLPGKEMKISSSSTRLNGMRKRKCCAGGVLENVYKKMRDADFALVCDGETIPCHKNILAGASSVFEAMIGNKKNKEAVEGEVDMNISAEVGRAFVEFIYTAKLDKEILAKEAVSFLELGDKYQMPGLKELAEEEMMTQLSRENMVKLLAISDLYRAKELREAAIKFTKLNMSWIRSDETRMEEVKKLNMNLVLELL